MLPRRSPTQSSLLSSTPRRAFALLFTVVTSTAACGSAEPRAFETGFPSRSELRRRAYRDRELLLVYGSGAPGAEDLYRAPLESGAFGPSRSRGRITIQSDRETSLEDLRGRSVYLVGTERSNRWIRELADRLPIAFLEGAFRFYETSYSDPEDVVKFFYPNPLDPRFPFYVTTGNADTRVARHLAWDRRGDFQVFRGDRMVAMGVFSNEPSGASWIINPSSYRDFPPPDAPARTTRHFSYFVHGERSDPAALDAVARSNEAIYRRISALLRGFASLQVKVDVHVYGTHEDKGLITGRTTSAHYDIDQREIHSVVPALRPADPLRATAKLLLMLSLGEPREPELLEGLAVHLADVDTRDDDANAGYEYWAARLFEAGEMPAVTEMFVEDLAPEERESRSELVLAPSWGSLAAFLLHSRGREGVVSSYRRGLPEAERRVLESDFRLYLGSLSRRYRDAIERHRSSFPEPESGFQKGFTHAHEGYQIYDGYVSRRSDDSLAKLLDLGTNAVAIVPYTFLRDPQTPAPLRIPRGAGSENDEGVLQAIATARRLGMTVMLKPQIWIRGSWPGDIRMRDAADRRRFFERYYRWMRHYALMAEQARAEILCIGVELMSMTEGEPTDWSEMVHRIRRLYSGRLVYAANWYREFDHVRFWKDLDYIGVNAYYPLSGSREPSDEELRKGFDRVMEALRAVQERYDKPVLITEVGFTSTPAPWTQPHEHDRRKPVDLEAQARSYELAFAAFKNAPPWLRGLYWWKWPSDPSHGGARDTGFTPRGKPAEHVVRRWYTDRW